MGNLPALEGGLELSKLFFSGQRFLLRYLCLSLPPCSLLYGGTDGLFSGEEWTIEA
jgi:hypothetical protein